MTSHEPDDASRRPRHTTIGPPVDPFAAESRESADSRNDDPGEASAREDVSAREHADARKTAGRGKHAAEASEPAVEEAADLRHRPVQDWDPDQVGEGAGGYRPKHNWDKDSYDHEGRVVAEVQPPRPPRPAQEYLEWYRKEQDSEALPKPEPGVVGKYPYDWPLPTQPPDPIRQFSSLFPKPRHRRSDWPVLVFVLSVAASVMLGCCLAGFALFTTWNPFTR